MAQGRVTVLGLGGTVSSEGVSSTDVLDYPEFGRKLPVEEIVAGVPVLTEIADIECRTLRSISSSAVTVEDWFYLRDQILDAIEAGAEAIVVLHGTGTLEETAYFLNLTLPTDAPVVLVGAQRPYTTISSDAAMNLISGVRTALSARGRNAGVLVVLNDEIHGAREVRKMANYRLDTFESPGYGPLGVVDGDQTTWRRTGVKRHTTQSAFRSVRSGRPISRVDIVYSYVGADDVPIKAAVNAGAGGLVAAAFAPGLTTPAQRAAFLWAREQGVMVVQGSRAVRDRVPPRRALLDAGLIAGDDLSPQKCRILLQLALSVVPADPSAIAELFETH